MLLSQPESPISEPSSSTRGVKGSSLHPDGQLTHSLPQSGRGDPSAGGREPLPRQGVQAASCWVLGMVEAGQPQASPSPPAGHSCSIGWWQSRIPAASGLAQWAGADTGLSRVGVIRLLPGLEGQGTPSLHPVVTPRGHVLGQSRVWPHRQDPALDFLKPQAAKGRLGRWVPFLEDNASIPSSSASHEG